MTNTPKTILVVDDDPVQLKMLQRKLSESGYNVITCSEAAVGLQMTVDKSPDLILLDVMMPIINGFNFCRLTKSQDSTSHIPIILVTSRDQREDVEIGMEMGADAYLTKPVNIDELLRTIKVIENMNQSKG